MCFLFVFRLLPTRPPMLRAAGDFLCLTQAPPSSRFQTSYMFQQVLGSHSSVDAARNKCTYSKISTAAESCGSLCRRFVHLSPFLLDALARLKMFDFESILPYTALGVEGRVPSFFTAVILVWPAVIQRTNLFSPNRRNCPMLTRDERPLPYIFPFYVPNFVYSLRRGRGRC